MLADKYCQVINNRGLKPTRLLLASRRPTLAHGQAQIS